MRYVVNGTKFESMEAATAEAGRTFREKSVVVAIERAKAALYIQRKGQGYLETVDEFETRKEARAMLAEYQLSDPSAEYYLSTRPCKDWAAKGATR